VSTLNFHDLLEELRYVPQVYGLEKPLTYSSLVAYLLGIDFGTGGLLLRDLHPWLVERVGEVPPNVGWQGIIPRLRVGEDVDYRLLPAEESIRLAAELLEQLLAYLAEQPSFVSTPIGKDPNPLV
jgi:hypothetical protein